MTDSSYSDDLHLAGLVLAATAAADQEDEGTRNQDTLGKRKRPHEEIHNEDNLFAVNISDTHDQISQIPTPSLQSSASVLFREPSTTSRKYSRPSLGKVFASLQLAPENFLRLQSAAKAFMLDEAHPERRDVVGHQKQSGAADIAKLNLWNCVEEFLSLHGHGEKYFALGAGSEIPNSPVRSLVWPADSQTIIRLMMPLMRKMVTNERQRVYAAESRKSIGAKDERREGSQAPAASPGLSNGLDNESTKSLVMVEEAEVQSRPPTSASVTTTNGNQQPSSAFKSSIVIHVNIVSTTNGTQSRLIPRFSLQPEKTPNLSALLSEVSKRYSPAMESGSSTPVVKVWLSDGLVTVGEDGEWMVALLSAGGVDWMDGEVRVLVEV